MGTAFGAVVGLAGVAGFLLLFFVVNAGLTYRIDCVTNDLRVSSHWTYQWNAPLPYLLAPQESGCVTHNATRVLLAKVGVGHVGSPTVGGIAASLATGDGEKFQAELIRIGDEMTQAFRLKDPLAFTAAINDGLARIEGMPVPSYLDTKAAQFKRDLGRLKLDYLLARGAPTADNMQRFESDYGAVVDDDNAIIAAIREHG
jgi:hypothetical protein